jgi:hypothetical protein
MQRRWNREGAFMLNRSIAVIALVFASAALAQPAPSRDAQLDLVTTDLHALGRIAALGTDLHDSRQVMLAIVDSDIEMLRERRDDGTYRWASLQREEASRVKDEKSIERVSTEKELREVTVTASNAYRVEIVVPTKRNLVAGNNRVYVRNVIVDSTGFDGKTAHVEIPVNAWVNPGDANGVPLPEIGKNVKATAELGVESGEKKAVATVALLQAKLIDEPTSPHYPAAKRLLQIRELIAAKEMQRAPLKTAIDEALLSLPGELDKRNAAVASAADRRRSAHDGQIEAGDASPDVVEALTQISRYLGGTLKDQTDARTKLEDLVAKLQPAPAPSSAQP